MKDFDALIVFLKYPRKGKVKTRLAEKIGDKNALGLYKACAEYMLNECLKISSEKLKINIFFSNNNDEELIKKWINFKFNFYPQTGNDLGDRMKNAFEISFKEGANEVLIIGTDIPDITSSILKNAFVYLNSFDSVIGPSTDGGYYLLGLKNQNDGLFTGIEWSTATVFEKTVENIKKKEMNLKQLPELIDIDTVEDLKNWYLRNRNKLHPVKEWIDSSNLLKSLEN